MTGFDPIRKSDESGRAVIRGKTHGLFAGRRHRSRNSTGDESGHIANPFGLAIFGRFSHVDDILILVGAVRGVVSIKLAHDVFSYATRDLTLTHDD
jgi:hypothetical protein